MESLISCLNPGPPPTPEMDMASGEMWEQFAASMANAERAGAAQQAAMIVSELPEFPAFKKMLDLGGGPGLIGIAIVASHPGVSGVIFDQPDVVKVAQAFVREYGMNDRMKVMGGDYTTDPIGEGYDLVWAKNTLNFAKDDMDLMITNIYNSLSPGGVFVVLHEGLIHERTKPDAMVLSMISRFWVRICALIRGKLLIQCFALGSGRFVHACWIRIGVRWTWISGGSRGGLLLNGDT